MFVNFNQSEESIILLEFNGPVIFRKQTKIALNTFFIICLVYKKYIIIFYFSELLEFTFEA